jgi:acetyl esterase
MATCSVGSAAVERRIRAFLEALAASGGKPMEQMTPTEARAVLTGTPPEG